MAVRRVFLSILFVLAGVPAAFGAGGWVRANFHAHSGDAALRDDGAEAPAALHRALRERGIAFSVHSPHSTLNTGAGAQAAFRAAQRAEARLGGPDFTVVVGEELTVRPGPRYQARTRVFGYEAPGNLDHLTVFGMKELLPSGLPLRQACERVHRDGGVCLVNHPGPGPLMWEEGLWEAPENRGVIDGIEVYNGQALAAVGIDFEGRYREATAYKGLGLRVAAVAGADTHGPRSLERAQAWLAPYREKSRLFDLVMPRAQAGDRSRPELGAVTLVRAPAATLSDVVEALRARRTVAAFAIGDLDVDLPGIGEVRPGGDVDLRLALSRPADSITLYREGEAMRTWQDTAAAAWQETVTRPAAYVFSARVGDGRLTTSAIWYEGPPAGR